MQLNTYTAANYVSTVPPRFNDQSYTEDAVESIWEMYLAVSKGALDIDLWELYESAQRFIKLHPMDPLARTLVRNLRSDLSL